MKGQILTLTRTTIIVVVILAFFVGALFFATQWDLGAMLSGSCGNGICESGETELLCPNDCSGDIIVTTEHIMILSDDPFTFTLSGVEEYLTYPDGGKEDCISCSQCTGCFDSQDYISPNENDNKCTECDDCDSISGTCGFCGTCSDGKSDHPEDDIPYSLCESCMDCTSCNVGSGNIQSEDCKSCEYCLSCEFSETIDYQACDYCSYYQSPTETTNGSYTGCSMCYNSDPTIESKYLNLCESCTSCSGGMGGTECQDTEPILCQRIKDCVASYLPDNPQPCVIDYQLSVKEATENSITSVVQNIQNTLSKCKSNPVYGSVADSGKQFICNYDKNKAILRPINRIDFLNDLNLKEEWKGDRDATYVDCGSTGYPLNTLYYNSWAFGNPPGMNYKIVIGDINSGIYDIASAFSDTGLGHLADGNCRFNMFVCAQPALLITTSADEADDYMKNPLTKIYSSIISMDEDNFKYFEEAPKQAVKSKEIEIDIGTSTANINDIADAAIAAVRDWVAISGNDANTINKINTIITKDGDIDALGDTIARKLKMNDRFVIDSWEAAYGPLNWEMVPISSSLRDNAYGNDDKLFYVYSYNTIQTPSTIPAVHEFPAISRNPIEGTFTLLNNNVVAYAAEAYLEWSYIGDCDTKTWLYSSVTDIKYNFAPIDDKTKRSQILNNDGVPDTTKHLSKPFDYQKYTQLDSIYWLTAGNKIQIKNEDYQIANSKIYYKYSLGAAGDKKYVFYETNDPINNINPQYTGKIKVQVAFYVESEKKRIDDDPYVLLNTPNDYNDDTLVLTPMISIAQVD